MRLYKPSQTILEWSKEGRLYPCKGLASIVKGARELGYRSFVDFGEGFTDYEEVFSRTVRMAVHEMDGTRVDFIDHDGKRVGWIYVIPSNDEDWLCDCTVSPWLEDLIKEHV